MGLLSVLSKLFKESNAPSAPATITPPPAFQRRKREQREGIWIRPFSDRVLLRRMGEQEQRKYHGLVDLPESTKEKPTHCKVVEIGDGRWNAERGVLEPMFVEVGDHVLISRFAGSEIRIGDDAVYVLARQDEILCGLEGVDESTQVAAAPSF